jgi:dienelactone hydrolase
VRYLLLLVVASLTSAASKPDWDGLRQQVRQTLHLPDPLPNLAEKSYGKFAPAKDVAADRVSFATDYSLRVPAIVYHPAGATITQHPAIILVNPHGGDKSSWYDYWAGILYARAGAIVLTYDPIGEYERHWQQRSGTRQHDTPLESADLSRRLAGLMITDILQSVRYLSQRTDVDPKNIAVIGYEMGSFISALTCAIDTSIHACVLVGGGDWDNSASICQATPYQSLGFLGDLGPALYALNAKRGPTLIYNGAGHHADEFYADLRRQTIALLGSKKDIFDYQILPGGADEPYFLTKPVALWLLEKLKLPNWTKKQLESMPETPAPEGGFEVLGSAIPAVPRADLRAIPDVVWSADQDSYIYESWRTRAKTP